MEKERMIFLGEPEHRDTHNKVMSAIVRRVCEFSAWAKKAPKRSSITCKNVYGKGKPLSLKYKKKAAKMYMNDSKAEVILIKKKQEEGV